MKVKVNYYSLDPRMFIAGTKNSYGFENLEFEFSPEWDGLEKTVTFYPADKDADPVSVMLDGNSVAIPRDVMLYAGRASFTVSGYGEGKVLVSVNGYLDVIDANDPARDLESTAGEDLISHLISIANEASEMAQSALDQVQSSSDQSIRIYRDQIADLWEESEDEESAYIFYCNLEMGAATRNSCVDVYFSRDDALSGKIAPFCDSYNGFIRIYATEDVGYIEIPMIKVVTV